MLAVIASICLDYSRTCLSIWVILLLRESKNNSSAICLSWSSREICLSWAPLFFGRGVSTLSSWDFAKKERSLRISRSFQLIRFLFAGSTSTLRLLGRTKKSPTLVRISLTLLLCSTCWTNSTRTNAPLTESMTQIWTQELARWSPIQLLSESLTL